MLVDGCLQEDEKGVSVYVCLCLCCCILSYTFGRL